MGFQICAIRISNKTPFCKAGHIIQSFTLVDWSIVVLNVAELSQALAKLYTG